MNEEDSRERDGGSFSDSSDSETELQHQVVELERVLSESPYHYESHVELIQLLRQQGDLDKARQARKNMSDVFPLAESNWLQWFRDELPLAVLPEAALELRMLFEKATDDYLSVPVWQEYIKFATERMSLIPEGMEYPRDVMERAITACGLHVAKSGVLWEAYIEFETAVLSSLQQMQQNDTSDDSIRTQVETQFEKVDKIFKRCLAVPHIGMETVFQEYQSFSDDSVNEESLPAYIRAKKKLEEYLPFENKLLSFDPPSLDSYRAYISHAMATKSDPTFINILYQRAIADHSLGTKLWHDYLGFLDSNFSKISSVLLPGYKQSVRNCPWMADYWIGYGRALERNNASHDEVVAVFQKALVENLSQGKDQLQVWTAFCDYLRRRVKPPSEAVEERDKETEDGNLVELRKTFKRARDDLEAYYGKDGDPTDSLTRYQASLESSSYGNMEEARRIWDDVMTRHGREAKYWIEYAEMERRYGDEAACRKLLQRSVNSASDDPECVCEALMQFEREVGTLESFELAQERCRAQIKRVGERREKAAEKEVQKREELKKKKKEGKAQRKRDKPQSDKPHPQQQQGGQGSKRKRVKPSHVFYDDSDEETEPIKRPKVTQDSHIDKKGKSLKDNPNQTQVAMETEPSNIKVVGPRESRTVFVSNLSEEITEEDLREIFNKCGTIADIRLIKTRRLNRLNTYAYVEFSTPDPVSPALELDKQDLQGKPMFVSPFKEKGENPHPSSTGTSATTGGDSHEHTNKATVFVTNLQRTVEQGQLQELFQQCGTIKDVRLIKNKAGRSKGFAYIEFENESSANIAVARLNQHQLAFKRIKVSISNPPKKAGTADVPRSDTGGWDDTKMKGERAERVKDGGFTKPSFIPRRAMNQPPLTSLSDNPFARRSKSQISLVPRVVARQTTAESASTQDTTKEPAKKMSNNDFRQLLLKKQ